MKPIDVMDLRILIVARNIVARAGLAALLESRSDCDVIGRSMGGDTLLTDLRVYEPDVVLLDLGWTPTNAMEDVLTLSDSAVPALVLLPEDTEASNIAALLNPTGAYGLLLRENDADTLAVALAGVAAGLLVIDPALSAGLMQRSAALTPQLDEPLTARENEVLQLLAQGLTNKAIGQQLGITDHTVKFHVNAIMTKLSAQSRTEAVVRATRAGLIIL